MADSTSTVYVERNPVAREPALASSPDGIAVTGGSPAAVELTDVAHRLGQRWALRGVTLRVDPGEIVAIAGANGSGKTTLLRVIGTSLTPTRGSGRVFGHDFVAEADAVRSVTSMLGHGTGLYDDLTAAENLTFVLRMEGRADLSASVAEALDAVGMLRYAREPVRALSSGMRRRIALARVMLRRPRLLLLDEPYNTFDVAGAALVDSLVDDTVRRGGAVLVVTHDLERNAATYDRRLVLDRGRVIGLTAREEVQ